MWCLDSPGWEETSRHLTPLCVQYLVDKPSKSAKLRGKLQPCCKRVLSWGAILVGSASQFLECCTLYDQLRKILRCPSSIRFDNPMTRPLLIMVDFARCSLVGCALVPFERSFSCDTKIGWHFSFPICTLVGA